MALSGNRAMIAADPSDPTNPACFKNSRRCVKTRAHVCSVSPANGAFSTIHWKERATAGESIAISQIDHNWLH
jgi:hypothetical protein